ncbi:prepilin-type N-terminal cleavage/methylation domain-containing protein [Absicoccus sp.]|uniref:prepilin-type N-terminal cleavage/methylation domain-containing protein n=1 Tax=Absicoccus sp. TaxID=2718527 RepID=UPI0039BF598B
MVDLNKNGFTLAEALLAFFIVSICVLLVVMMAGLVKSNAESRINHEIETKWFYTD